MTYLHCKVMYSGMKTPWVKFHKLETSEIMVKIKNKINLNKKKNVPPYNFYIFHSILFIGDKIQ